MIVSSGSYKTRSGLQAKVMFVDEHGATGTIPGAGYGRARGTSSTVRWALDGTHEFSRTDDLVCTWDEYIGRLPAVWRR